MSIETEIINDLNSVIMMPRIRLPDRVRVVDEEETKLTKFYISTFQRIRKDPDYPTRLNALRSKYDPLIYRRTRATIERIHRQAMKYLGNKLRLDIYSSDSNIYMIKQETDQALNSFWSRIEKDSTRTLEQEFRELLGIDEKPDLKTVEFMNTIAIGATSGVLGRSTLTKIRQVKDQIKIRNG